MVREPIAGTRWKMYLIPFLVAFLDQGHFHSPVWSVLTPRGRIKGLRPKRFVDHWIITNGIYILEGALVRVRTGA